MLTLLYEIPITEKANGEEEEEVDYGDEVGDVCKPSRAEMFAAFQTIRRGHRFIKGVSNDEFHILKKTEHNHDTVGDVLTDQDIRVQAIITPTYLSLIHI